VHVLPRLLQQPMAMAKEFDLVSSWNSYITNSNILRVRGQCCMCACVDSSQCVPAWTVLHVCLHQGRQPSKELNCIKCIPAYAKAPSVTVQYLQAADKST
jgi:hypothetical protein